MKKTLTVLLAFLLLCGCSASPEAVAPDQDPQTLEFTVLNYLYEADRNLVFSPVSLGKALDLLKPGAAGETAKLFDSFRYVRTDFTSELVESADSVWINEGYELEQDYLDLVSDYVKRTNLSYAKDEINAWVNEKTHGLIPVILDRNPDPLTRLLLINSLYFKGKWKVQFAPETSKEKFTLAGGQLIDCEMMRNTGYYNVSTGKETVLVLPYDDEMTNMVIVMTDDLQSLLDEQILLDLEKGTEETYAYVKMPKFTIETTSDLTAPLKNAGLAGIFDPKTADFSRISSHDTLYVSDVLQKARIIVDTEGTEAAAVTIIDVRATSAEPVNIPQPKEVIINRPFIFFIENNDCILFVGVVNDPNL